MIAGRLYLKRGLSGICVTKRRITPHASIGEPDRTSHPGHTFDPDSLAETLCVRRKKTQAIFRRTISHRRKRGWTGWFRCSRPRTTGRSPCVCTVGPRRAPAQAVPTPSLEATYVSGEVLLMHLNRGRTSRRRAADGRRHVRYLNAILMVFNRGHAFRICEL